MLGRAKQKKNDRTTLSLMMGEDVVIEAAAGDGAKDGPTKFKMTAYTGVPVVQAYWDHPIVVDLAGLAIPARSIPIRNTHSRYGGIGHSTSVSADGGRLYAEGVVSRATPEAREVVASMANGFPWQASIGANVDERSVDFIAAGQTVSVNNQQFSGPLYVARKSELYEISFVDIGADTNTEARIAAARASAESDTDLETQAMDKTDIQATGDKPSAAGKADATNVGPSFDIQAAREEMALETERVGAIRKICAGTAELSDIEAKAIRENWDVTKVELEAQKVELEKLRNSRPNVRANGGHTETVESSVIEAALAGSVGMRDRQKQYDEKTLEAADKRFKGGLSLQELLVEAAQANGYSGRASMRTNSEIREILAYAFPGPRVEAAFSTIDVSGILSNVANKFSNEAFLFGEQTWRTVSRQRPANDFKTTTVYRLNGDVTYEKVAPSGEIKHGELDEASYTLKADTYGKMLSISRNDIVSDDLGAFQQIPRMLGTGAIKKLNNVFWTAFMDNASFFTSGRDNYISGASTVLSVEGLSAAEAAFMNLEDEQGEPVGNMPAFLLVPPALMATANQLMKSTEIRDSDGTLGYGTSNPHAGKYTVAVSRYLQNASYTGNSSTAFYLLANPNELPVIEVAFLNGAEAPTVESAEADFSTLGIQMRGYHDFGVGLAEYHGGVMSKGAS